MKKLVEVGWEMHVHMRVLDTHSFQEFVSKMSLIWGDVMHKECANGDHSAKNLSVMASRVTR
jgi:hypothetical protein